MIIQMGALKLEIESDQCFYGFAGMSFDAESGLYCTLNRCYDPNIGRWTTVDPLGLAGGDTNLYRYANNNPLSYTDPLGTQNSCVAGAVGGIIGVYASGVITGEPPSAFDYAIGAVGGALVPNASIPVGALIGYASYLTNAPLAGNGADGRPLPPDIQALITQSNNPKTNPYITTDPYIDPNAGKSVIKPVSY